MSVHEFDESIRRGEKLWVLDDLVLDLKEFASKHPGGAFAIERTVGKDVSKYFYGGYAIDSNSNVIKTGGNKGAWIHTNIARKIVNQLAIARLVRDDKLTGTSHPMEDSNTP
jgi:cytochrome b involved in lipid metabolism